VKLTKVYKCRMFLQTIVLYPSLLILLQLLFILTLLSDTALFRINISQKNRIKIFKESAQICSRS